jgi:hypothetical protein
MLIGKTRVRKALLIQVCAAAFLVGLCAASVSAATIHNLQVNGTGTVTISSGACPSFSCATGPCFCFQYSGTIKGTGISSAMIALTEQEDTGTRGNTCAEAFGFGTLTEKNGDTVDLDLGIEQCDSFNATSSAFFADTSGTFNITGGTGKLANAAGGGGVNLTTGDVSSCGSGCTATATFFLDGGFTK